MEKLVRRLNATVRPSGETAGAISSYCFIGGEVKVRVSPVSIDAMANPSVTTRLPSGSQASEEQESRLGKGTSATRRSGPPMEGMTMKVARSFETRMKPMDRPSGEKAGLTSSA